MSASEPPWEPGQTFDATFPVTLETVWAEPPWQVGAKFTATMDEPHRGDLESDMETNRQ